MILQSDLAKELGRLVRLGMLEEERRDDARRVYYERTGSPLWMIIQAAADALLDDRNQYPPMPGVPELRQAVATANQHFYGLDIDWAKEVTVTSGATEAVTASLMAVIDPGDPSRAMWQMSATSDASAGA